MSIEMDNPITPLEKVDAAHNLVAQIILCLRMKDYKRAEDQAERASELLFEAKLGMEESK